MSNNVVEYIRANRGLYTREAIDVRLRAEGYTDEEIEVVWRQMPVEEPAAGGSGPPMRASGQGDVAALVVLTVCLGLIGLMLVGLTDLVLGLGGSSSPSGTRTALLLLVNLGSLAVLAVLGVGGSWLVRNKGWSVGKLAGLILAVAVVWYLIVLGTCVNGPNLLY